MCARTRVQCTWRTGRGFTSFTSRDKIQSGIQANQIKTPPTHEGFGQFFNLFGKEKSGRGWAGRALGADGRELPLRQACAWSRPIFREGERFGSSLLLSSFSSSSQKAGRTFPRSPVTTALEIFIFCVLSLPSSGSIL